MNVGVLALQGCVTPHLEILKGLGVTAFPVTLPEHLEKVERLIIPGGESTTMLKFLRWDDLFNKVQAFGGEKPVWGVCAGSILMASQVENPAQESLNLIPVKAVRNFYGSQHNSFNATVTFLPHAAPVKAQFIRAPRLSALSDDTETLATYEEYGVAFRRRRAMVSAFHTELLPDTRLHEYFLKEL